MRKYVIRALMYRALSNPFKELTFFVNRIKVMNKYIQDLHKLNEPNIGEFYVIILLCREENTRNKRKETETEISIFYHIIYISCFT